MLRGFPKHEVKHKVGCTKEVGVHWHEECTKVWGTLIPREMKVDECMGSFLACGSMKGCIVHLGAMFHEGV
jgi:hypothetical protein